MTDYQLLDDLAPQDTPLYTRDLSKYLKGQETTFVWLMLQAVLKIIYGVEPVFGCWN